MKYGYVKNSNEIIYIDDTKDGEEVEVIQDSQISDDNKMILNLYKKYGSYNVSNIDINELKKINSDTIGWLVVDGTNINYPVLKTNDNSFYLTHDFNKNYSIGGWIFMDYRNSSIMDNKNTVIYGHNLINKTAFGSLSSLFTDKWFDNSNHKIIVYTLDGNYTFEIFSVYYKEPESYYLNTNFSSDNDYLFFLKSLKSRSIYDFNVELNSEDKIITLSTCTDNNKGRKVVHAKLIR
jgi:sortase B